MSNRFNSGRFDFIGKAKYLVPLSLLLVAFGVVEIAVDGLDYGIDFAGGTEIQMKFDGEVAREELVSAVETAGYQKASVQRFGEENEYLIRMENVQGETDKETNELLNQMVAGVTTSIETKFQNLNPVVRRVDSVGPQVGEELKRNGFLASFYSLILILIYIGLRFDYKYAPGAVFCLFHDAALTLCLFAIFDKEVNVQTMAAILTLIGYSLNDTIITFDRIRENETIYKGTEFSPIVNRSINDMLTRTILTSITTLLACASLYFFTDGTIRDIGFTLGIGIIIGAYSSIAIAAPMTIGMDKLQRRRAQARMRTAKA